MGQHPPTPCRVAGQGLARRENFQDELRRKEQRSVKGLPALPRDSWRASEPYVLLGGGPLTASNAAIPSGGATQGFPHRMRRWALPGAPESLRLERLKETASTEVGGCIIDDGQEAKNGNPGLHLLVRDHERGPVAASGGRKTGSGDSSTKLDEAIVLRKTLVQSGGIHDGIRESQQEEL
jgi:hypothetical protein